LRDARESEPAVTPARLLQPCNYDLNLRAALWNRRAALLLAGRWRTNLQAVLDDARIVPRIFEKVGIQALLISVPNRSGREFEDEDDDKEDLPMEIRASLRRLVQEN